MLSALLMAATSGAAGAAALLPLHLEEAATLPSGTAEATLGASYFDGLRFPPFTRDADPSETGLGRAHSQSLLAAPQLGFRIAAGNWAEIQAAFEMLLLHETRPDEGTVTQFGTGDARLFTKVSIIRERRIVPAFGFRFGTKLPNANRKDRLGTDDVDFGADVLASKYLGPVGVHANLGLQLLGNPGPTAGQDDLFSYTIGFATRPLGKNAPGATQVRFLGEIDGLTGSRFDNARSAARLGVQFRGPVLAWFAGVSAGLIHQSENVGFSTGVIWTFQPASLFGDGGESSRQ